MKNKLSNARYQQGDQGMEIQNESQAALTMYMSQLKPKQAEAFDKQFKTLTNDQKQKVIMAIIEKYKDFKSSGGAQVNFVDEGSQVAQGNPQLNFGQQSQPQSMPVAPSMQAQHGMFVDDGAQGIYIGFDQGTGEFYREKTPQEMGPSFNPNLK